MVASLGELPLGRRARHDMVGYVRIWATLIRGVDRFLSSTHSVREERRRNGLGTRILFDFVSQVENDGSFRELRLDVETANKAAIALYSKAGFQIDRFETEAKSAIGFVSMFKRREGRSWAMLCEIS